MNREESGSAPISSRQGPLFAAGAWASVVACVLSRMYLGVLLSLAVFAVLPALLGWHGTVVQSGSMEPHISPGDVVLAADLDPTSPVPVGGVVEFTSPASAEPSGVEKTRLHRIVYADPDGTFVTAGDANASVDSTPLVREQIAGQARLLIPAIGLPGLWLGKGDVPALALWSFLSLLAVWAALFGGGPADRLHAPTGPSENRKRDGEGTDQRPAAPAIAESGAPEGGNDPGEAVSTSNSPALKIGTAVGIVAALIALILAGSAVFSSAAFSATTDSAGNGFSAAADWNPPSVTLTPPGASIRGNTELTAQASDAEGGVRSVTIEYAPAGGAAWTALCTTVVLPYTCAWATQSMADGPYSLRATATDDAGLTSTSPTVETRIVNALTVALTDPGEIQRGTVTLTTTVHSPGGGNSTVRVEYSPAGANRWSPLCSNLTTPYTCTWNTTTFANDYYDLRSVAVSGSTSTNSETVADILVDNLPPTVSMNDPGTPLSGTRSFSATAADAHSGIAQTQIQYTRTGTWATLCTVDTTPYSCRFDTTALANGTYSFRAIATDAAGISTTSGTVANRVIDNTISSVSVEDPGAYLTGVVTLNAVANSGAGVSSVRIQTAPAGASTWTTRCTLTTRPFACSWDTRTVPDGSYDLRAILTDGLGRETLSATVTARRVDNSPFRGVDIQTSTGSGTPGRAATGDIMSFTYSQQVNLTTVSPGWSGAALPVTVRLRDGNLLGTGNAGDTLDVQRTGSTVNLGSVNLKQDFVRHRKTSTFNATMSAATVTVNGAPRTVVTVTLGASASGATSLRTVTTAGTMIWTPSATVTNDSGISTSNAPATETAALDIDF